MSALSNTDIRHARVHYAVPNQQPCWHRRTEHTSLDTPVSTVTGGCYRKSYGGHSERETPGPIPNPEVKPFSADGTATERLWESRTPPDIHFRRGHPQGWPLRYLRSPVSRTRTSRGDHVVAEDRRSQRPARGGGRPSGSPPRRRASRRAAAPRRRRAAGAPRRRPAARGGGSRRARARRGTGPAARATGSVPPTSRAAHRRPGAATTARDLPEEITGASSTAR